MAMIRALVLAGSLLLIACVQARAADGPPVSPAPTAQAHFPWTSADAPPIVAGVRLGDSRSAVETKFGPASAVQPLGSGLRVDYPERGLDIVFDAGGSVTMIYLLTTAAGSIDGLRVGDERATVLARWGEPSLVQGAQAMYLAGDWAVVVELDAAQQVGVISLARTYGNTDLL